MNKYDNFFTPDMSSKQVTLLYFQLCDEVANDENEKNRLYDAHMRAWENATKREADEFNKAFDAGYILCTN